MQKIERQRIERAARIYSLEQRSQSRLGHRPRIL